MIIQYDSKWIENNIVEKLMITKKYNWEKIRGGKYVRYDIEYKFPVNKYIEDLPICNCNIPCDIKQDKDGNLYFRCAKKNIWDNFCENFDLGEPCKFFMKYTKDEKFKLNYINRIQRIKSLTFKSNWLKELIGRNDDYCMGGCGKEYDGDYTIRYNYKPINLCFDCFLNKNTKLREKYKQFQNEKCMIEI